MIFIIYLGEHLAFIFFIFLFFPKQKYQNIIHARVWQLRSHSHRRRVGVPDVVSYVLTKGPPNTPTTLKETSINIY